MCGISHSKHYKLVTKTVECNESTGREWGGNNSFASLSYHASTCFFQQTGTDSSVALFYRLQIKIHCHLQLQNHGLSSWHPILWSWWCQCAVSHSLSCGWQACKCCGFWQSNSGAKKTSTVCQVSDLSSLRHSNILKNVFWYLNGVASIRWNLC